MRVRKSKCSSIINRPRPNGHREISSSLAPSTPNASARVVNSGPESSILPSSVGLTPYQTWGRFGLQLRMGKIIQDAAEDCHPLLILREVLDELCLQLALPFLLRSCNLLLIPANIGPNPLVYVLELHCAAIVSPDNVARADAALLVDIAAHIVFISELLIDFNRVVLLLVALPAVARVLVEIPNRWPSAFPGALAFTESSVETLFRPVDLTKDNSFGAFEFSGDFIPRRSLPLSVRSSCRVDPSDKYSVASIDLRPYYALKILGVQQPHMGEVV